MHGRMRKANAILEYGIVLFIAVSALVAMRQEIKRAIAGKIKDFTDAAIGEQGSGLDPKGTSTRNSHNNSSYTHTESQGGEMQIESTRRNNWNLNITQGAADVVDYAKKPPEILYPNAEYIEWAQSWELVP